MRLEAIELDGVAIFDGHVRVGGLAPGLNVLAGPNERGKSTLLTALTTLFTEPHRTRKQTIERLRPYGGGAPRITCDFELGGDHWRLEKQYLSAPKAELATRDGRIRHIGPDAENALAELLAGDGALMDRLPLLWVRQGEGADLPRLPDGLRHSLGEILAAEAEASSGGATAKSALAEVEARLGAYITISRGQPKRGGPYARRLAERDEVRNALERADQRARQADAWITQLTELQKTEAALSDPEAIDMARRKRDALERRFSEASRATEQVKLIGERLTFLGEQRSQRAASLTAHDEAVTGLEKLRNEMKSGETETQNLVEEDGRLETAMERVAAELADTEAREKERHAALDRARGAHIQVAEKKRREQLEAQLAKVDAIEAEIATLDRELAAMDWPDRTLRSVEEAARQLENIEMRLTAAAPALKVSYVAGRSDGFTIDGEGLADGEQRRIVHPLTVEVADVGRLEIRPALTESREKREAENEHWQHRLTRHLEAMGASSVEDAAEREALRENRRQRRRLFVVERDAVAPAGRAAIEAELEGLAAATRDRDDDVPQTAEPADEIAAALDAIRAERTDRADRLEAIKARRAAIETRRAQLAAERVMRRTRLSELETMLGAETDPAGRRAGLAELVTEADNMMAAAHQERAAFAERALPPDELAGLETEIDALRRQDAGRDDRLTEVRQEMRRIEGILVRDFEEGAGEEVSALAARLEASEEGIFDLEQEIAALQLLAGELGDEIERHRREISGPLAARLGALAARLWPDAEVALTPELEVARLARHGRDEVPLAISRGTHEQLAVLARLAYADMLAGQKAGAPIILDDPFVYSDDARLDRLFDVMAEAGERHQIIILTCHARAFEPLVMRHGARRLEIEGIGSARPGDNSAARIHPSA